MTDRYNVSLGWVPRAWQRECYAGRKRFSVWALHRRAGKTDLSIQVLVHLALKFVAELGLFVYIAPLLNQARNIAWARLKARIEPLIIAGAVEVFESNMSITFRHNRATIRLFGADDPDKLRGLRIDGAVVDETPQIKPELWDEVLMPALSDRKGWAIFIGTPSGINLFSQLYYKALSGDANWAAAKYTVYETDALPLEEIDIQRQNLSETSFAREFMCSFEAAGDDQLIPLADAQLAAQRIYKPGEMDHAAKVLGVDVARFGDDRTVFFKRQGLVAFDPIILRGQDNMQVADAVARLMDQWEPDAVFIDEGGGAGVIDRLRQLGRDPIGVNFGGKPTSAHYLNRRAQMWGGMREWLLSGGAIPDNLALKQELATPIYWYDTQGKLVLEPKEEIKKRLKGGASPDLADALALTFAMPVAPRTHPMLLRPRARDYDPYALA